jgi:hypothetical protein
LKGNARTGHAFSRAFPFLLVSWSGSGVATGVSRHIDSCASFVYFADEMFHVSNFLSSRVHIAAA